ncbi:MAG: sigma 54-interacting transcriptional regulator, partial [Deltaproteobacteria bacterium]|nr:sigma 54-interacting transcriptional regulator [Deltaproteobacteria bacterium]
KTIEVDVRIIAASNKNLSQEMASGRFRTDLYYRLNVVPLIVPPLRDRREDIPDLARKFLSDCLEANNLGHKKLDESFVERLKNKPWPGNVRELKNTIERLAIITSGEVIDHDPMDQSSAEQLPKSEPNVAANESYMTLPYRQAKAEFERRYFLGQLRAHNQNITQTAEAVSLDRTSLHKKLKSLGFKDWVEGNLEKSS